MQLKFTWRSRPVHPFMAFLTVVWLAFSPAARAQQGANSARATGDSVYTAEQAAKGETTYRTTCASCHIISTHSDENFKFLWNGRTVFDLVDNIISTMPQDEPGSLTRQQYVDIIAYLLKVNGNPAGKTALPTDSTALRRIRIDWKGSK